MSTITYRSNCVPVPAYEKDSVEWHRERSATLGASEVGIVLGVSTFRGLLGLVLDKRDALAGTPAQWDSDAMALGRLAEEFILSHAETMIGAKIIAGSAVRDSEVPVSATPDGLVLDAEGVVVATVEAKLDRGRNDWTEVSDHGFAHLTGPDARLSYWWQVQAQLRVTGAAKGYLAVWTVYAFHLIEIAPDPEAFAVIDEAARRTIAWVNAGPGSLPPATAADELATLARTVNPATEGPVEVDGPVAEAIEEYARLGGEIKVLEERQDAAKRVILEAHRTAAKLATANGFKSSFSDASERVSFDSKAFGEAHPDLVSKFQKVTKVSASCRVTSPKAKKG
jgi:predicted phage-related endonuclease